MLSTEAILVLSVSMAILAGDRDTRHKTRGTKLSNTPKRCDRNGRRNQEGEEKKGVRTKGEKKRGG